MAKLFVFKYLRRFDEPGRVVSALVSCSGATLLHLLLCCLWRCEKRLCKVECMSVKIAKFAL
jgi:hypothetical protein